MIVPLPPVEEITEIVRQVNDVLVETEVAEHSHSEIDLLKKQLRQSVLKLAFEGGLVPQDFSGEPASTILSRLRAEAPPPRRTRGRKLAS